VLPPELRDGWRRKACSSRYIFTPSAADLQPPSTDELAAAFEALAAADTADAGAVKRAQGAAEAVSQAFIDGMKRCCLAALLWWARWGQGEPIIVREAKVRLAHGFVCVPVVCVCGPGLVGAWCAGEGMQRRMASPTHMLPHRQPAAHCVPRRTAAGTQRAPAPRPCAAANNTR
jgi:hypothetical protein